MLNNDKQLIVFIKKQTEIITKKLNLSPIKIEINEIYDNCGCYYEGNKILFGLPHIKQFKNKQFHLETVPSDTFYNRVYFIIAHEVAHLLQYTKFPKWHLIYKKRWRDDIDIENYSKQKIEKNASKIANILLKEYKKGE